MEEESVFNIKFIFEGTSRKKIIRMISSDLTKKADNCDNE